MIRKYRHFIGSALALALPFVTLSSARADDGDPPSRVARLAYAQGAVSFQPGGTQDWVAATINRPLTIGDQLWADRDSRAELELDGSSLRLAGSTAMSLLNLGDNVTQIQLSSGTLVVRVRRLDDNETYEIDTPNLAFSILRPGLYRLSVDESGASTSIRIRSGQGEVTGGGTAYTVRGNENDVFSGTDLLTEYRQPGAGGQDAFDAWSEDRDARWEHSVSSRYVSPDVVGYEDLDDQGTWRPMPEYGNVWFPNRVEAGWAPYHSGHWSYIAPWGYTWVDDQPWGFAPFHYGRWISVGGAWGWIPCPPRPAFGYYVRPVYAPALVAWVGVGAGVAWFALGPREVFVPSYPVSRRYVNNINVSNTNVNTTVINNVYNTTIINNKTVNVTNVNYVNRNVPGAVAAVSSQAFKTAQPVSRNFVKVDQRALSSAPVRAFAPVDVPTKQAVLGSAREVDAKPPAVVQTRAVVARRPPPPPQPAFEKREQALQANGGRPLSATQVQQIQTNEASPKAPVRIAPTATPIQANGFSPKPLGPAAPSTNDGGNRAPVVAVHPKDLPPVPKPPSPGGANSALEREQLQQQQQLRAQQEEARQRIQQQQEQAHQQLARQQAEEARRQQAAQEQQRQVQQQAQQQAQQQRAEEARRQQLEQQHQQQTQQLAQQHALQQEQLQKQQQDERRVQESQTKPGNHKSDRPPNPRDNH